MLTKKNILRWLNAACLVLVVAAIVVGWLLASMPTGEKVTATLVVLAALKSTIPWAKKEVSDAIKASDLPEDDEKK